MMSRIWRFLPPAAWLALVVFPLVCSASEPDELLRQADQLAAAGKSAEAVAVLNKVVELEPKSAGAYYLRGRELFRIGKARESVADFDKYVELRPELASRQWERGISLYYAGEFEK